MIFDATTNGYTTWRAALVPATMAILLIVSAVVSRLALSSEQRSETKVARRLGLLGGAIATILAMSSVSESKEEFNKLSNALRTGTFERVEGRISDFVAERADGHPRERFKVGGKEFIYSSSDITSGFHWTAGQGGPLREGMQVRIAAVNGRIARLEIAR